MKRVLLIAGEGKKSEFFRENPPFNPERYEAFVDIFGEGNFGIVEADELKREIETGNGSETYWVDKKLNPHLYSFKGLESNLVIASTFDIEGRFPSRDEVFRFMDYLESQKAEGIIGDFVNSRRSTLFEDKNSTLLLQNEGFRTPVSYHIGDFSDLENYIEDGKTYVLKPRFGGGGKDILKLRDLKDLEGICESDMSDCVLQEELDIQSESRLLFFDYEFIGARIIHDRKRPWDSISESQKRKHANQRYSPSQDQVDEAKKIMRFSDTVWGCVDFAHDSQGDFTFLEINGVGTGLGYTGGPYNFNRTFAQKIKEKYLK